MRQRRRWLVIAVLVAGAIIGAASWAVLEAGNPTRGGVDAKAAGTATAASRNASGTQEPTSPGASETTTTTVAPSLRPYDWAHRYNLIAHGFGAIDGLTVTSTLEAFERNYERGYRVFEVDLSFTRDGRIAGRHDWSAARFARYGQKVPAAGVPTLAEFKASLVKGSYHPVDAAAIVDLMQRHPDAWVMTDLKIYSVQGRIKALKQLLAAAGNDDSIRQRLIVQIYEEADAAPTRALGIENLVYTFYRLQTPVARALDFAKHQGIKVITVPVAQASSSRIADIKAHGLICAVHTINDKIQAASLRKRGASLLYSDSLHP